jgi:Calcineurin-like phosphoesterase
MRSMLFLAALGLLFGSLGARAQVAPQVAWVQFNVDGVAEARVGVPGDICPPIVFDGAAEPMHRRSVADQSFPVGLCSAVLPSGVSAVSVLGVSLPVPIAAPQRILVVGDTGCRIQGTTVQACNDSEKWPFPQIATAAAGLKPDLVIHVGDYLYRESQCPTGNASCAGTPWGDNWPTWQADFFTPAAPLLAAAPWVIVRGNHEECARSGPGWLRLLGPLTFDPSEPCVIHMAPYEVPFDSFSLAVMDDADAPDANVAAELLPAYRRDFGVLSAPTAKPRWLLLHRPIWGAIAGPFGLPIGGNQTLIAALRGAVIPDPVTLMLSGHIHSFEAINYDGKTPPQIVEGDSGDNLDPTPSNLKGAIFPGGSGVTVKDGISLPGFGFLLMARTPSGWTLDLYRVDGRKERECVFANARIDCSAP